MRIALFGGTFDPIHSGHLRAARAAARKFRLDRILFVPSGNPPHKAEDGLTPFSRRYAMVVLATTGDPRFFPSLLEEPATDGRLRYSIDTVRAARRQLSTNDEMFFLLGADAFRDLPHWKDFRRLLDATHFIVASRPGYSIGQLAGTLPSGLEVRPEPRQRPTALRLRRTTIHILPGLDIAISSRQIRETIRKGGRVAGLVPRLVEEYILKEGLYRPAPRGPRK
ncbi:MAG: nicotinate (nicotinamide) nucleotide adenylyltransferase [Acidobacteria bacterium]|nr:nicotinate (nicotinamide) nucleotide adenylyltransferase [Acidobacteriota bacterium]